MPENTLRTKHLSERPLFASVQSVMPMGLIVRITSDGRKGLVREREIAWDIDIRKKWMEQYKKGDNVQVVPLGKTWKGIPELSIRLAQHDPWRDIENQYIVGDLINGIVTGVMPYGVFVELEPGVTGLIHISHFPSWADAPPGDMCWPGDKIKVVIKSIHPNRRRIGLSLKDLSERRWRDMQSIDQQSRQSIEKLERSGYTRPSIEMLLAHIPQQVLVVEDDEVQGKAVVSWLRYAGQIAETVTNAEDALNMIPSLHPDLVLVDIGLPGIDGIEAVTQIKARWPDTRCTLMTDWSRAEYRSNEIRLLKKSGVPLLIKPLLPEDLLEVLLDIRPDRTTPSMSVSSDHLSQEQQYQQRTTIWTQGDDLGVLLARILKDSRADKVVLFELDSDSHQFKVTEQKGRIPLRLQALPELIHSPVRDVAEGGQTVLALKADEAATSRFKHLNPLLEFNACLGVPVAAQLRSHYALFLFFNHDLTRTDNILTKAEDFSRTVGNWLERQQFLNQTADLSRLAMMGQLTRALVHEISGRLSPLNLTLQRLQTTCSQEEESATTLKPRYATPPHQAAQELQILSQQTDTLARTIRAFSRMTRSGKEEIVLLDEIINEAVNILEDTAKKAHVEIYVLPASHLYFTRAKVTYLQQAIVNLVQNAIQQIHLLHPQKGGYVVIQLGDVVREGKSMIQVIIKDDGPGIHRRLWERIFDMDYTTRSEGNGLGLYLSRNLIESQGGRIYVEESYMLWGTTFVVELPFRT